MTCNKRINSRDNQKFWLISLVVATWNISVRLLLLFLFVCLTCSCTLLKRTPVVWHQHYEPVEQQNALLFTYEALDDAQNFFGSSIVPVQHIHIRHSIPRKHYALLTRADIVNWGQLAADLISFRNSALLNSLWAKFDLEVRQIILKGSKGDSLSLQQQLTVVAALNKLIRDRTFYHIGAFSAVTLSPSLQKHLTVSSFTKNDLAEIELVNRQLLEALLPASILPMPSPRYAKKGVELCECLDCRKGIFVIYISVGPGDPAFFPQLGHEALHIINPYLYDWYVEGLCNVFSEKICTAQGIPWTIMERHFQKERTKDPYAISYFMMREIYDTAGEYIKTFLGYAVWSDAKKSKMHIDIDRWLSTLPVGMRTEIVGVINVFGAQLQKNKMVRNSFIMPSE